MAAIVSELHLGRYFPIEIIEKLFSEADLDKDGKISFPGRSFSKFLKFQETAGLLSTNFCYPTFKDHKSRQQQPRANHHQFRICYGRKLMNNTQRQRWFSSSSSLMNCGT